MVRRRARARDWRQPLFDFVSLVVRAWSSSRPGRRRETGAGEGLRSASSRASEEMRSRQTDLRGDTNGGDARALCPQVDGALARVSALVTCRVSWDVSNHHLANNTWHVGGSGPPKTCSNTLGRNAGPGGFGQCRARAWHPRLRGEGARERGPRRTREAHGSGGEALEHVPRRLRGLALRERSLDGFVPAWFARLGSSFLTSRVH